jgi:hypothetical protein
MVEYTTSHASPPGRVGSAYVQISGIKTGTGISSEMAVDATDFRVKRIIDRLLKKHYL